VWSRAIRTITKPLVISISERRLEGIVGWSAVVRKKCGQPCLASALVPNQTNDDLGRDELLLARVSYG
jgi:hypothetical protein